MRNKLDFIFSGGLVKRYHVMDTLRTQNNAEHSFGVAWLVYMLSGGMPSAALLIAALQHDLAEQDTGDLPAPAKRRLGISEQFAEYEETILLEIGLLAQPLSEYELRILKLADCAELCLFCIREIALGNKQMHIVYQRGISYIHELGKCGRIAEELITVIEEKYDECQ